MLPTIVGWMVQWKVNAVAFATVNERLEAPGAISPRSAAPPSTTMWWVMESLFFQTISPPLEIGMGLGEKAPLPLEPTIETVVGAGATGDGAGVGVGLGVGVVGVTTDGDEVEDPPDDPPPQAQKAGAAVRARTRSSDRCMLMVSSRNTCVRKSTKANGIPRITLFRTIC
jgi:hypothetical protein